LKQITETSPVQDYLENLHAQFAGLTEGSVATYIPELAKADPNWFGICLVTASGAVYEVGDSRIPFTIQSISKPFVYGMALEECGRVEVLKKVGLEPTGNPFNSISLEAGTGRPLNPMINAGAIASTSLVAGDTPELQLKCILNTLSLFAGSQLSIDASIYRSESETGHRNRAIGYMLRNFGILTKDPIPTVETYFQQCSVTVTCRQLGLMAATLANRGTNPVTGKRAIRGEYVENVLSIMGSCGMYDAAGEWMYSVGMPAKSGVAGGIIAVLPGHLGIGVFSPPLNTWGNSVRGIKVCDALSRHCDLHLFNRSSSVASALRLKADGTEFSSNRSRPADQRHLLRDFGSRIHVYQLQGELSFSTAESVVRDIIEHFDELAFLLLDFRRVLSLSESACWLLHELLIKADKKGKSVVFSHTHHLSLLRRYMTARLGTQRERLFRTADDNDLALEWCENALLARLTVERSTPEPTSTPVYELCQDLDADEYGIFSASLQRRRFKSGEIILKSGDPANEMFFLAQGEVSVLIQTETGSRKRLAAMGPGMTFGEMAVIDGAPRSATVVADTDVECDILTTQELELLGRRYPEIRIKLLKSLTLSLSRRLRAANRELGLLR
jgi:glutaminase